MLVGAVRSLVPAVMQACVAIQEKLDELMSGVAQEPVKASKAERTWMTKFWKRVRAKCRARVVQHGKSARRQGPEQEPELEVLPEEPRGSQETCGPQENSMDAGNFQMVAAEPDMLMDGHEDTDEVHMMQQHFDWSQVVQEERELIKYQGKKIGAHVQQLLHHLLHLPSGCREQEAACALQALLFVYWGEPACLNDPGSADDECGNRGGARLEFLLREHLAVELDTPEAPEDLEVENEWRRIHKAIEEEKRQRGRLKRAREAQWSWRRRFKTGGLHHRPVPPQRPWLPDHLGRPAHWAPPHRQGQQGDGTQQMAQCRTSGSASGSTSSNEGSFAVRVNEVVINGVSVQPGQHVLLSGASLSVAIELQVALGNPKGKGKAEDKDQLKGTHSNKDDKGDKSEQGEKGDMSNNGDD